MAKYVLTEKVTKGGGDWWRVCRDSVYENASTYESFDEAKKAMRETIIRLTREYDSPFGDDDETHFEPFIEYMSNCDGYDIDEWSEGAERLGRNIYALLKDPSFEYDESEKDVFETDECDHFSAYVGNADMLLVTDGDFEIDFETNAHNMKDPDKNYYFEYLANDEINETVRLSITVCLMKAEG